MQDHYTKLHSELNYVVRLRTGIHNLRGSERSTTEYIDDWDERMFGEQRDELGEDIEEALKLACVAVGGGCALHHPLYTNTTPSVLLIFCKSARGGNCARRRSMARISAAELSVASASSC